MVNDHFKKVCVHHQKSASALGSFHLVSSHLFIVHRLHAVGLSKLIVEIIGLSVLALSPPLMQPESAPDLELHVIAGS